MRTLSSVTAMQRLALSWRRRGIRVGLVPTMGFLHQGHLTLMSRARRAIGRDGKLVVSLFVNPIQFGPREDFSAYPRDLEGDLARSRQQGVDVVFAPTNEGMYDSTGGVPSTFVTEEDLSQTMEGTSRPTHFRGVTTVVAKLFNLVLPDVAVFGEKDYQQLAVIRRMVRDLNFPVRIIAGPTVRETDGLALSSRNRYLTGGLRDQATVLSRAIAQARKAMREASRPLPVGPLRTSLTVLIEKAPAAKVDYIEFFDPVTLRPRKRLERGTRMALAVKIGKVRLIDNATL